MQLNGRALITGASAGIGAAYVRQLAGACSSQLLVARRRERLEALADELAGQCRIDVLEADLTTVEGQARVVEAIRQGPPLSLLVNNAGFSTFGPFVRSNLDAELAMLRLHEQATLALTRAALPAMAAAGTGAIVNVASIGALFAMPAVASYGATKAFLLSFSRSLRAEVGGHGIAIQCLCPGYTRTEIHGRESFRDFDPAVVPDHLWMTADEVVAASLEALAADNGGWLVVPGAQNRELVRRALAELADAIGPG